MISLNIMIDMLLSMGFGIVWIIVLNFGEKLRLIVISVVSVNISVE